MEDFVRDFLTTDGFMPRWSCGNWTVFHGWLAVVADLIIFAVFVLIPVRLFAFVRRSNRIGTRLLALCFCAFMLSCGLTHLADAAMFFFPYYRIDTAVHAACAVVSASSAVVALPITSRLLAAKTYEELEDKVSKIEAVEQELRHANRDLKQQILFRSCLERELSIMRDIRQMQNYADVEKAVDKLDGICEELSSMMPSDGKVTQEGDAE